jgi:hypothetical protein
MKPIHCYQYMVDLILAYLNTTPQVEGLLRQLSGLPSTAPETSGPSYASSAGEINIEDISGRVPRPIRRRLSLDQRDALVRAFASGTQQRDLAVQYSISVRSVKRLVRAARESGATLDHKAI